METEGFQCQFFIKVILASKAYFKNYLENVGTPNLKLMVYLEISWSFL